MGNIRCCSADNNISISNEKKEVENMISNRCNNYCLTNNNTSNTELTNTSTEKTTTTSTNIPTSTKPNIFTLIENIISKYKYYILIVIAILIIVVLATKKK